jgi:heme oxygenase (biliverdin-IX-beta and delta-forming)
MIMAKLKEATRIQHEGVENSVDIMSQMFSIEDYKSLLVRFYRFYNAVEPKIESFGMKSVGYDFEVRRKRTLLEKDLLEFDLLQIAPNLPSFDGLLEINSIEQAFGCLYVIEGSTLGGQIINRHLKQQLQLTTESGGAFFNGYGEKTGMMWKEFCGILTDYDEKFGKSDEIIQAAKATFESINMCLSEPISLSEIVH